MPNFTAYIEGKFKPSSESTWNHLGEGLKAETSPYQGDVKLSISGFILEEFLQKQGIDLKGAWGLDDLEITISAKDLQETVDVLGK